MDLTTGVEAEAGGVAEATVLLTHPRSVGEVEGPRADTGHDAHALGHLHPFLLGHTVVRWVLAALSCEAGFVVTEGEHEMTRSRLAGLLASGVLVLSAAVAPTSSLAADAAALADCSLANTGMIDNRWEGGPSGDWSNPANWSLKAPPGQSETPDQNVCIPDDVTITLDAPGVSRVDLLAIELGRRAKLLMDPGTSLFVGATG